MTGKTGMESDVQNQTQGGKHLLTHGFLSKCSSNFKLIWNMTPVSGRPVSLTLKVDLGF